MGTDPALVLAQWFSPGFPMGAFAYSHGLEWIVAQNELTSPERLFEWVEAILADGTGRNDAIFIGAAFDTVREEQLTALNDLCLSFCISAGRLVETREQGAAFGRTLRGMKQRHLLDYAYPVAVGRAASLCTLPLDMTLRFYLNAFASNLVAAAVRRAGFRDEDGQKVIYRLHDRIETLSKAAMNLRPDNLFELPIARYEPAASQNNIYARMFHD
ncbi:MAG: urease accessory protein UreF [Paracoccaceae bacterium]